VNGAIITVNLHRIGNTPSDLSLTCLIENCVLVDAKPRMGLDLKIRASKRKEMGAEDLWTSLDEPQNKVEKIRLIPNDSGNSLEANQLSKSEHFYLMISFELI
jgi:hypothetical protein